LPIQKPGRELALMVIALDYDGTWTVDPKFWRAFVHMAINAGHTVIMVTQRCRAYPEQVKEVEDEIDKLIPIIFAGDPMLPMSKSLAAKISDRHVDIWIDDNPQSVIVPMYKTREGTDV